MFKKAEERLRDVVMTNPLLRRAAAGVLLNPSVRRYLRLPGGFPLRFDYPYDLESRWGHERPLSAPLVARIERSSAEQRALLQSIAAFNGDFARIPMRLEPGIEPAWDNGWLPALDGMTIYGLLAGKKPKLYLEVGSGNSTKFAHRARRDHRLDVELVSIDPGPRAEIDQICDQVIRRGLEKADLSLFGRLRAGDVLFIDNSHRSFTNSDVTVFFLDVLPNLPEGVIVGLHDIYTPYDYPPLWRYRYYNEQYLLACYLLAEEPGVEVILPTYYLGRAHEDWLSLFAPILNAEANRGIERFGSGFWMKVTRKTP